MSYIVKKADLENDALPIISFWRKNFPDWSEEKYQWFYKNNPNGKADCWLISDQGNNMVVAASAIFPRSIYVNGNQLKTGIAGDFAVDQHHRILGPALKLQKELVSYCKGSDYSFIYGYPNRKAEAVLKRAGHQLLGPTHRMVRIVDTERILEKYLGRSFFIRLSGKLLNWVIGKVARESRQNFSIKYRFETAMSVDHRFDDLWQRGKLNYSFMGERSSAFLRWRLDQCPSRSHSYFLVSEKNNDRLVGYIAWYVSDKVVNIADMFCEDLNCLERLLLPSFLRHTMKQRFGSVSVLFAGQPKVLNIFKKYHFISRPNNRNLIISLGATSDMDLVDDIDQWYFFEVDND